MKYFLHDTSAFDDEKISELFLKFGYEGLGLFYTALEKIGKQEKPIKTDILKAQLRIGKKLNKCWEFMEEIELISSSNGESFNNQLLNFSETYQIKKEKTRKKVAEWRERQDGTKNVTGYVPVSNPPKVNESKVNESKEEEKEREEEERKAHELELLRLESLKPKPRVKKPFVAPSVEEVKTYFSENGFSEESAIRAFKSYDVANWFDSKGNIIQNWKQKMIHVWFDDKNKIKGFNNKPKSETEISNANYWDQLKPEYK